VRALDRVDLTIADGDYFVLLGPSGGGKTTLLRLIGGFVRPSAGSVSLFGEDVSGQPPERRPTSMVFQSYALFPHMTVAGNVGYGLRLRRLAAEQIREKVGRALEQVSMSGYEERHPWELSGGQQQRVQLARALVLEPRILLLDEPLAALDAQLRKDMCFELKRLQEKVGITFVHVTHNQEEAMTVADRIALIADGRLVEEGDKHQIYERPRQRFTAGFMGERNLLPARVETGTDGSARLTVAGHRLALPAGASPAQGDAWVSLRAERALLGDATARAGLVFDARVEEVSYLGAVTQFSLATTDGTALRVRTGEPPPELVAGAALKVGWSAEDVGVHAG
jgi:ABC-type Fe3+/spermidine/putrescine transport system ATPase subunit